MSNAQIRSATSSLIGCSLTIVLLIATGQTALAQTHPGKVGIGLEGIGGRGMEFVDAARTARSFEGPDGGTVAKDAAGWPNADCSTVLFDARPVAAWEGVIDDPQQYQIDVTGTYKMSFNGQADISVRFGNFTIANKVYNSTTNTTTADLINNDPLCAIRFTNTRKTGGSALNTGISNLKVHRPGYAIDSTQLFHTPFINALNNANFAAMRFMDWTHTNNNNATYPATSAWSDRPLMNKASDAVWGDDIKMDGAPWETVVLLANQVNKDIWINVPVSASDDYVTKLAQLIRYGSDGVTPYTSAQSNPVYPPLNSTLNIYVELSNEVWNSIFTQQDYAAAAGSALGITEHQWVARRTAQVRNLFANVFGSGAINGRVRIVLCNHAPMLQWWVQPQLEYINNTFGAPSNYIYMICRQGYFSPSSKTSSDTVATLLSKAQQDIDNQNAVDTSNNANRSQWIQKGTDWALVGKAGIYEGGPHFPCCSDMTVLANEIAANRDVGMRDLLQRNYGLRWADLGGTLAMHFTLSSGYNRYGCWGLTDDITNPDRNYKFQAMRNLLGTGGGGTAPPTPTGLTATPGNGQVALSWNASSGATSYNVKRSTTSGSGFSTIASPTTTSYTNTGLTNGTTYYYVVSAVNSNGESANSSQVSATPSVPTGGTADVAAGTATVDAVVESAWNNATAYTIGNIVGTIGSTSDCSGTFKAMWNSSNLYVLVDVTDDNKSNDSTNPWEDDSVEIYVDGNNDKTTTYDTNDRQIVCGWNDTTPVEGGSRSITGVTFAKADPTSTTYRIEANVPWSTLGVTKSAGQNIGLDVHINDDDAGGPREGKRQWNDTTDTAWSNPSVFGVGALQAGGSPPPTPTGLTASAGDAQVTLDWTASSGADSYNVKRSTTSGSGYSTVGTSTDTHHVDSGLTNGTTYYYVVSAVNSFGESANSSQVSATPMGGPVAAPTFSPAAGTYTSAQSVTISTATSGASIRYTTDGSNPTSTTGTLYSGPVTISVTTTLKAIAFKTGMLDSSVTSGTYTIDAGTLPSGWTAADIGNPSPAGSTSHSSGSWTVRGGGADIWGSSDQFHYAYRDASGDTTIIARVDTVQNTHGWAKAGVMIRNGTAANAQFAMVVVTPGNGVSFQRRTSTGGSAASTTTTGITAPRWVRLVRSGNNFTASHSSNGTSWTSIGSAISISMPTATKAGLCVTSHANGTLCTATMSNVSVTTGGGQVAAPTFSPAAGTYTSSQSVTISTTTSGASIRYTTDGSTPTSTTGTVYAGPVTISTTTTLKAIAYMSGMTDSSVTTGVYTIDTGSDATIASGAATIDATVETAWSNATAYTLGNTLSGSMTSSDLSVTWKGLWDSTSLYLLAEVTDDSKRNDSTNAWDDDSVELYVDGGNEKATSYDTNDRQYVFGWNDTAAIEAGGRNVTGVTFAKADPTSTSYRVEAKVPWSAIGITTPAADDLIGIDVHVNDDDDGAGRDGKKSWFATTDNSWSNPSTFATANLAGATNPASVFANAGFENDLTSWNNTGSSAITTDAASGTKAVITGTGSGGVNQEVAYTAGGTLNINVKAKVSGTLSGWTGLGVDFLDSAGTEIGEVTYQVTATSYTAVGSSSVTVPAGTARLRFWTWKPGTTGNLFVDDVVVLTN